MASSSSSKTTCFQCQDSTSHNYSNGWRLRSGEFAQLCHQCGSAFEDGRFCETFHSADDGWRDCESCGKLVHCGCVVSFHAYLLMDFGGVICMECSKANFILARNRCLSHETQNSNVESQGDVAKQVQIEPDHWPRVTHSDIQKISRTPTCAVVPLFEKVLTVTDADLKFARLSLPKQCAETFFPILLEPSGCPIKIQDTEGKEWEFHFRYRANKGNRKTYILEGIRGYMMSVKWQAGDIVTFYRKEPEGKLVMGLRKKSADQPPH